MDEIRTKQLENEKLTNQILRQRMDSKMRITSLDEGGNWTSEAHGPYKTDL